MDRTHELLRPWTEGPFTLKEAAERYGEALVAEALRERILKPVMTRLGPVLVPASRGRVALGLTRHYTPRPAPLEDALLVRRQVEEMVQNGYRVLSRKGAGPCWKGMASGSWWWAGPKGAFGRAAPGARTPGGHGGKGVGPGPRRADRAPEPPPGGGAGGGPWKWLATSPSWWGASCPQGLPPGRGGLGGGHGGVLIAIGERDRGITYLIAALLGGILAAFARPLLRGLLGI